MAWEDVSEDYFKIIIAKEKKIATFAARFGRKGNH